MRWPWAEGTCCEALGTGLLPSARLWAVCWIPPARTDLRCTCELAGTPEVGKGSETLLQSQGLNLGLSDFRQCGAPEWRGARRPGGPSAGGGDIWLLGTAKPFSCPPCLGELTEESCGWRGWGCAPSGQEPGTGCPGSAAAVGCHRSPRAPPRMGVGWVQSRGGDCPGQGSRQGSQGPIRACPRIWGP